MHQPVFSLSKKDGFTLDQARERLHLIRKITEQFRVPVERLMVRADNTESRADQLLQKIDMEITEKIQFWKTKIKRLGGIPDSLWAVAFQARNGYFSWTYPEKDILYWYNFGDHYNQRKPLLENLEIL